jgi:putative colanic acid biosynthesis acetyltransferase WcaF
MVSQYAQLIAGTHDATQASLPLVAQDVVVGDSAWVCAGAFIGPGVTVGHGALVAARAVVFQDVEPWVVVMGNPARKTFPRRILGDG